MSERFVPVSNVYICWMCAPLSCSILRSLSVCCYIYSNEETWFWFVCAFSFIIIHVGYSLTLPRSPSYRFVVPHISQSNENDEGKKDRKIMLVLLNFTPRRIRDSSLSKHRDLELEKGEESWDGQQKLIAVEKLIFSPIKQTLLYVVCFFVCLPSYDVYTAVSARRRKNIDTKYKSFWFLMLPHDSLSSCACQSIVAPKFALFIIEFNY